VIGRMTFEEYLAIDAINVSTLKEMRRSPQHYAHRLATPREDTARLALGRATHTAVLEPDRFLLDYALFPGERRAGKVWEEFQAANAGKTILKRDEYETCLAMRDAVRAHPVASALLRDGRAEESVTWEDEATGLQCKARIDWHGYAMLDLKTTADVDAGRFAMTAARLGYHLQLAFYSRGLRANGIDLPVKIVAVEATAPHDVAVFGVEEETLVAGSDACDDLLRSVSQCRTLKFWPGRYSTEQVFRLPTWAVTTGEDATGIALAVAGQGWEE
jgi:hypothetical protein